MTQIVLKKGTMTNKEREREKRNIREEQNLEQT